MVVDIAGTRSLPGARGSGREVVISEGVVRKTCNRRVELLGFVTLGFCQSEEFNKVWNNAPGNQLTGAAAMF